MGIAENYVGGLIMAYRDNGAEEQWYDFEKVVHGASKEDLKKLSALYPDIPDSLLRLLEIVDGTYWREYDGQNVTFYFLGSDIEEYPYYLLSCEQMVRSKEKQGWLEDFINREFDGIEIDERIIDKADEMCWLHFADCMNNGGSSQLFIDFSPSSKGVKGQIVRYLHDPDEFAVIADSFDDYLQMLMDSEYDFINEDTIE